MSRADFEYLQLYLEVRSARRPDIALCEIAVGEQKLDAVTSESVTAIGRLNIC
jgi:hypothetical protein